MPRIVRIINRLNLGGPTYNAAYLTKYLAPEFETILVAGVKKDTEESSEFILKKLGVEPVIIPQMSRELSPLKDIAAYNKISSIIRKYKPDIVHTHAAKAGALGRVAAIRNKVPILVHTFHGHFFHSYFSTPKTIIFAGIERWLAKRCDAIVALSETQKHELGMEHRICEPEKIRVVPLGFDLARFSEGKEEKRKIFREKYFLSENEIAIGIIGRMVRVKNHPLFVKALKIVLEKTSHKVKAFIIGDGEERNKIETLAAQCGIEFASPEKKNPQAKLIFTSWMKDVDVAISGLDIIAMTSLNEGTPVSLIEAQAGSKPVVTTAVGGIEDVVIPGETALLSSSEDVETFAGNLLRLVEDKALREKMQLKGKEFVMERFSYQRLTSDMAELYRELLNKRKTV
ncbi:MAG TPA: glycosyltransferase [Bacteroidia bacterium]|nr:glycosyltransferase [Bacteroidia bacterium]